MEMRTPGAKALISEADYGTAEAVPFVLALFPQPGKPNPPRLGVARLKLCHASEELIRSFLAREGSR
jgi:hypothetical protein